jgi:hypothetical protein
LTARGIAPRAGQGAAARAGRRAKKWQEAAAGTLK